LLPSDFRDFSMVKALGKGEWRNAKAARQSVIRRGR
jgi:hypothetical protein